MTVDEFFEDGFDSDVLDEDEEEQKNAPAKEEKKDEKKKSGTAKHKNQMESLKEKDPEFYKFLQENDEDLLDFSGSDSDDDDDDGDDDGKENDDSDDDLVEG